MSRSCNLHFGRDGGLAIRQFGLRKNGPRSRGPSVPMDSNETATNIETLILADGVARADFTCSRSCSMMPFGHGAQHVAYLHGGAAGSRNKL